MLFHSVMKRIVLNSKLLQFWKVTTNKYFLEPTRICLQLYMSILTGIYQHFCDVDKKHDVMCWNSNLTEKCSYLSYKARQTQFCILKTMHVCCCIKSLVLFIIVSLVFFKWDKTNPFCKFDIIFLLISEWCFYLSTYVQITCGQNRENWL